MSVENRTAHNAPHQESATVEAPIYTAGADAGYTAGNEGSASPGTAAAKDTQRERRMLYRHPSDTVLGGVCGGLGDYFGWDAALVRILWVVITLATSGGGLLAYLALWILLPVGTSGEGQQRPARVAINEKNLARAAWILIALGGLWLLGNVGVLPWLWGSFWRAVSIVFWPLLLIGVGYMLLRYIGTTNGWNLGFGRAGEQVKSSVGERMPNRERVKSGFNQMRQGLPLKRSRSDRMWMGVCGGLGKRLGVDSNLVRLIWAAFSVGSIGMGVLLYVLAGLFLVEEGPVAELTYGHREDGYGEDAHEVEIIDATSGRPG